MTLEKYVQLRLESDAILNKHRTNFAKALVLLSPHVVMKNNEFKVVTPLESFVEIESLQKLMTALIEQSIELFKAEYPNRNENPLEFMFNLN